MDRDDSTWTGQRNHLPQQVRVTTHGRKDEPDVGEVERFARKPGIVSVQLEHFDVLQILSGDIRSRRGKLLGVHVDACHLTLRTYPAAQRPEEA